MELWLWIAWDRHSIAEGELSLIISTTESYLKLFETAEKTRQYLEKEDFQSVRHDLRLDTPSYNIDANALLNTNLSLTQIAKTIEIFFSGDHSLTFSKDGILYMTSPLKVNICLGI